ncbi:MAG: glycine zipper domain-containing protein [Sedimenticola sp.]|nr:glycine zipper domain-containing protein [Sedimenticola sp.]
MKVLLNKIVPLVLSGILVTGCVTNSPKSDSASGGNNQSDTDRTKTEGAVFGAVLGGLLGLAAGGDKEDLALGAALGAGVGYLVGNEVAKRKQAYATNEEFLDAEIARTAEFNKTAKAYNERLQAEIVALDKETDSLRAMYQSGQATRNQLLAKKKEMDERIAKNQEFESTLQKEYEINTEVLAQESKSRKPDDPYITQLVKENSDLKAQIERLRKDSEQMAQINERLSV